MVQYQNLLGGSYSVAGNVRIYGSSLARQWIGYITGTTVADVAVVWRRTLMTSGTDQLTAGRALFTGGVGEIAASAVTSTELGYLSGAKSNIQSQIDLDSAALVFNSWGSSSMANVSIPSGTTTNAGSFELTKGLYWITITASWGTNATGYRSLVLSNTSTGNAINYSATNVAQAVGITGTVQNLSIPISITSNTTYYIVVRQNSGANVTVNTRVNAVRLKTYA